MRLTASRLWATIVVLQLSFTLILSNALTLRLWDNRISNGAIVAGIDISGFSPTDAAMRLAESYDGSPASRALVLTDGENNWTVDPLELGFVPDFAAAAENAYQYVRQGSLSQRVTQAWMMRLHQVDFPLGGDFSMEKMMTVLGRIESELYRPPVPARIETPDGNSLVVIKEQIGRRLDREKAVAQIKESIFHGKSRSLLLPQENLFPEVRESDFSGINQVLASCTTKYNPQERNRSTNIEIATQAVNGTLVRPGEEFSLNATLGPRTKERGYQLAPVFKNRLLTMDLGGGICQLATTLYNALLQTDLEVKERWPHSFSVDYAPPGLDATLMGSTADLKFRNSTDCPVYISAVAENGSLTVTLFGAAGENVINRQIVTEKEEVPPPVVVKYDSTLPKGESRLVQKGKAGYRVKVFRITETEGGETSRELLSENYYYPQPTIYSSGDSLPNEHK